MSLARRDPAPGERSTPDALMDAALDQLAWKGVLAGLNLREVAEDVGVTPANIYYWFGSRQELLRAALAGETRRPEEPVAESAAEAVARQIGIGADEVHARARAVFARMLDSLVATSDDEATRTR